MQTMQTIVPVAAAISSINGHVYLAKDACFKSRSCMMLTIKMQNLKSFHRTVYILMIICLFILLGIVVGHQYPTTTWIGVAHRELVFKIVDSESNNPINGAEVALRRFPGLADTPMEFVRADFGYALINAEFKQYGIHSPSVSKASTVIFSYGTAAVTVEADGYEEYNAFLGSQDFLPDINVNFGHLKLSDPAPPEIVLKLRRNRR